MNRNTDYTDIFRRLDSMRGKSEEELDKELFVGTPYDGMKFERHGDWIPMPGSLSTPIFAFENGDKIAWTKTGRMVKYLQIKMENNLTYDQLEIGKAYIMIHDDETNQQDICLYKGLNVHVLNLDRVSVMDDRHASYTVGSGIFMNENIHVHFKEIPMEVYEDIVNKFKSLGSYVSEKISENL